MISSPGYQAYQEPSDDTHGSVISSTGYQAYQEPPDDNHGPVISSPGYQAYLEPPDDAAGVKDDDTNLSARNLTAAAVHSGEDCNYGMLHRLSYE